MRKAYPSTSYHIPSQGRQTSPSPQIGRRMSLLALHEELQLPTRHGLVGTHRLRIIRIEQSAILPDPLTLSHSPLPEPVPVSAPLAAPPRSLPPPQPALEGWLDGQRVHLRSVGETMTDEAGNFYEVHGQHLRPLGALVSDEHGRIFEVQPVREAPPATIETPASASAPAQSRVASATNGHHVDTTAQPARTPGTHTEPSPAYRTIVADPGLSLQLPWAHVKSELMPYLQHPETLHDDDRLACYAQIYEARRTLPAAQLAASLGMPRALPSCIHSHKPRRRCSAPQLFKPTREPFEMRATSRHIYAGQRVYRLCPVFDPTSERIQHAAGRPLRQRKSGDHMPADSPAIPASTAIHLLARRSAVRHAGCAWHPAAASTCADALAWHLPAAFAEGRALYTYKPQAAQEMA